jgi:hypothetical protein
MPNSMAPVMPEWSPSEGVTTYASMADRSVSAEVAG